MENKIWIPKCQKDLEDKFNKESKEREWVIWGSKAAIDAVEKAIEDEFKNLINKK